MGSSGVLRETLLNMRPLQCRNHSPSAHYHLHLQKMGLKIPFLQLTQPELSHFQATCTLECWAFFFKIMMVQFKLPQLKSVFPRTEMTRVEWCHGFLVPNLWLTPQQIFSERQWKISLALSKRCSKLYRIKKFPHDSWCKMNLGSNFGSFPALQKSLNAPFWVLFLSGVSLSNLWGVFCDFRAPMAVHEDFPKKLPRLRWSIYIYK